MNQVYQQDQDQISDATYISDVVFFIIIIIIMMIMCTQIYTPLTLIVFCSWVSFWLVKTEKGGEVPARSNIKLE